MISSHFLVEKIDFLNSLFASLSVFAALCFQSLSLPVFNQTRIHRRIWRFWTTYKMLLGNFAPPNNRKISCLCDFQNSQSVELLVHWVPLEALFPIYLVKHLFTWSTLLDVKWLISVASLWRWSWLRGWRRREAKLSGAEGLWREWVHV